MGLPVNCFHFALNNETIEIIEMVDCDVSEKNIKIPFGRVLSHFRCPNLKHLTMVGSISFEYFFDENETLGFEVRLNKCKYLESMNLGNNGIKSNVANAFLNSIRKHKEKKNLNLKSFNILDDDNADPELKQIQDEINKLLTQNNLGKGLRKTRKNKKKHKKRSTKPKTKNNYKRDI